VDKILTNVNRAERLRKSTQTQYDLIVIGGGITGAGIALDATLRGIKTLLIEKKDFASGTSSKSTKLIHGGLRYLKQFEFGIVRETGLERAVAHNNIPHLVHPEKMLLPIVKKGSFSKWSASLAISVYDRLAAVREKDRKKVLSRSEALESEPILNPQLLKSAIAYSEYRTDDARLTIETIKAACREGAEAFNYLELDSFLYHNEKIVGVKCLDHTTKGFLLFKCTQVVSAAGPWVDKLRDIDGSKKGDTLHLTKGVHIVVPHEKLPVKSAVYFDAFDSRMLFAIPRGKITYIGTSDTNFTKDMNRILCTKKDAQYIIDKVNRMFEMPDLKLEDIISTWAGLRPLISAEGKSNSELSRKDEIFESPSNLISIAGGKLTGFRKMAERVVDLIIEKNDTFPEKESLTKKYKIHSDSFVNYEAYQSLKSSLTEKYKSRGISSYDVWYLLTTFGKHAISIIENALLSDLPLEQALMQEEIQYSIKFESSLEPDDYFNRRSGRIYFDIASVKNNLDFILSQFKDAFSWDQEKLTASKAACQSLIDDVSVIKD